MMQFFGHTKQCEYIVALKRGDLVLRKVSSFECNCGAQKAQMNIDSMSQIEIDAKQREIHLTCGGIGCCRS